LLNEYKKELQEQRGAIVTQKTKAAVKNIQAPTVLNALFEIQLYSTETQGNLFLNRKFKNKQEHQPMKMSTI
jgi:hypothetical protein